jgi:hypothetical protein
MVRLSFALWIVVVLNGVASGGETARWSAPVVLTGDKIPKLKGIAPKTLVAFKYTTQWQQIPVQVDERAVVDFLQIYGPTAQTATYKPKSFKTLVYTDPGTLTGGDPDVTLDNDDEVAFMLRDSGVKAPSAAADPAGVIAGSGVEVAITDPVTGATPTYAYLFRSSGTLQSSAGKSYVNYAFSLVSGDYKSTYKFAAGPNPETSTITTPYYKQRFSDRWITDSLMLLQGTGVDILDMQKFEFAPGYAGRTVKTFCAGEGAFVANRNGPVRAIRSFIGANSGPSTQRTYIFYEAREDIITNLRVHEIPGGVTFFDYSAAAKGMRYSNNNNPAGVIVDGVSESIAAGPLSWEMLTGTQGTLCIAEQNKTDIPNFRSSSYYLDATNPVIAQPTGDSSAYGSSGPWMNSTIPNTDPASLPFNTFTMIQSLTFESLSSPSTQAARRSKEQLSPLAVSTSNRDNVTPANRAPVITSYTPQAVISLTAGVSQSFQIIARDDDGDAMTYSWSRDGQAVAGTTSALTWTASGVGTHTITVKVADGKGGSDSQTWTVTVNSTNQFPVVKIASPANGSTYTAPATISGTIQASDPDGTIAKVEIFVGTKLMSTLTKAPYTLTYYNVAAGSYYITATATDNLGAATTSAPITITVKAATANLSELASAPETQNHAPVLASGVTATPAIARPNEAVAFSVVASDADGDALAYSWDFGDGMSGSEANLFHAFAAAGEYVVSLVVSDGNGASVTSSVIVSVKNPDSGTSVENGGKLSITDLSVKLFFAQGGKDSLSLSGTFQLPDGFTLVDRNVSLDIGGVNRQFLLNSKNKAASRPDKFSLKVQKDNSARFTARLSKGMFTAALADEGFTADDVTQSQKSLRAMLTVGSLDFGVDQVQSYTAKAGKGKSLISQR